MIEKGGKLPEMIGFKSGKFTVLKRFYSSDTNPEQERLLLNTTADREIPSDRLFHVFRFYGNL